MDMDDTCMKKKIIFVLGGPGAGKTTQCENIEKHFGYKHFSAGELLRHECHRSQSKYAKIISECMHSGTIVPTEITLSLLKGAVYDTQNQNTFLIDGFPRNQENLDQWLANAGADFQLQFVLFLDCAEQVCIDRVMSRGEIDNRLDDNLEMLGKRFKSHYIHSMPIISYFRNKNQVHTINTSDFSKEEVFEKIRLLFAKH